MVIRNFNLKNLLKIGFVGMGMFAAQSFASASPVHSQANPMPLVMSDHLLGLYPSAGTLVVDNQGAQSVQSAQVQLIGYSDDNCTAFVGGFTTPFPGNAITWTPRTYSIMAASVYLYFSAPSLGNMSIEELQSVQSLHFIPVMHVDPTFVFNPSSPCFKIHCDTDNLVCTAANDAMPQTVSLINAG